MLFPIGDDNRDRNITPVVNYILIGLNIFVCIFWQNPGHDILFSSPYSHVPAEILTGRDIITDPETFYDPDSENTIRMPGLQPTPVPVYLTLLTSMFMQGGLAHIAAICFTCEYSATIWKMLWDIFVISFFICSAVYWLR
jgi:membrane associated rhomboid family serine protease